jgi:hypothetical protein
MIGYVVEQFPKVQLDTDYAVNSDTIAVVLVAY